MLDYILEVVANITSVRQFWFPEVRNISPWSEQRPHIIIWNIGVWMTVTGSTIVTVGTGQTRRQRQVASPAQSTAAQPHHSAAAQPGTAAGTFISTQQSVCNKCFRQKTCRLSSQNCQGETCGRESEGRRFSTENLSAQTFQALLYS